MPRLVPGRVTPKCQISTNLMRTGVTYASAKRETVTPAAVIPGALIRRALIREAKLSSSMPAFFMGTALTHKRARDTAGILTRGTKGQSLVEVMAGFMVFIPLAFLAVDVVGVTSASQSNEQFAESIARVAANQGSQAMAQRAAEDAAQNYQTNNTITGITVELVKYDVGLGQVSITTAMNFKLPIPMPGYTMMVLRSNAVQPIVATPAPL